MNEQDASCSNSCITYYSVECVRHIANQQYHTAFIWIMISSHMLSEIELVADDIGILNHGNLLFEGSLDNLRNEAKRRGFGDQNLEEMFLSLIEADNASRKQRAII